MTIFNIEEISMQVFDDATGKISLVIVNVLKAIFLFVFKMVLQIYF